MKTIATHSLLSLSRNILQAFVGLLVSIIISRALGPEGRGFYILVLLMTGTTSYLCNPAIYASANYYLSTGKWSSSEGFQIVLISSLFSGTLAAIISVVFLYFLKTSSEVSRSWPSIVSVAFLAAAMVFSNSFNGLFYGARRIAQITYWKLIWNILQIITMGTLFFITKSVEIFVIIFSLLNILDAVIMVGLFVHLENIKFHFDARFFKPMLAYGLPVYSSRIVAFLGQRADSYLVLFYLGSTTLGIYSISSTISEQMWLIPAAISMVMMPNLGPLTLPEAAKTTRDVIQISILLTIIVIVAAGVTVPFLIPILYGREFGGAALPFLLRLLGTAAISIYMIMEPFFQSRGWPKLPLWISILGMVSNLIFDVLLIPEFSMNGAALASTAAYLLQLGLTLWLFQRKTKLPLSSLIRIDLVIKKGISYLNWRFQG